MVPKLGMVTSRRTKEGGLVRSYVGDTAVEERDDGLLSSMDLATCLGPTMTRSSARREGEDEWILSTGLGVCGSCPLSWRRCPPVVAFVSTASAVYKKDSIYTRGLQRQF